jgi:thiamine-phosphate pyrophosphorylase
VLRYYITDRRAQGWSKAELLECIARNVRDGVDYIQIRERDLTARELFELTMEAVQRADGFPTRILVNDRADIALAAGAHGVHLRSNSISPDRAREILPQPYLIGVSCHSIHEVQAAQGADFLVFGPVFESPGKGPAQRLAALAQAAAASQAPVLALGGVDEQNAKACMQAGATGITGIRLKFSSREGSQSPSGEEPPRHDRSEGSPKGYALYLLGEVRNHTGGGVEGASHVSSNDNKFLAGIGRQRPKRFLASMFENQRNRFAKTLETFFTRFALTVSTR